MSVIISRQQNLIFLPLPQGHFAYRSVITFGSNLHFLVDSACAWLAAEADVFILSNGQSNKSPTTWRPYRSLIEQKLAGFSATGDRNVSLAPGNPRLVKCVILGPVALGSAVVDVRCTPSRRRLRGSPTQLRSVAEKRHRDEESMLFVEAFGSIPGRKLCRVNDQCINGRDW